MKIQTKTKAFTLVELIVVITILAILGTIAFIPFQGYSRDARNSVRYGDIKKLELGLETNMLQSDKYIFPENYTTITASGNTIRYQGIISDNTANKVGVNGNLKDPSTGKDYNYSIDGKRRQYQLSGYFENDGNSNILNDTFASSENIYLKTFGNNIGFILENDELVNISNTGTLDIRNTTNNYEIVFSENDIVESNSGVLLFSYIYNRDKNLLLDRDLAKLDETLVLYFDMETLTYTGGLNKVKDFSKYGNHGECYAYGTRFDCLTGYHSAFGNFNIGKSDGFFGKATYFDGTQQHIRYGNNGLPDGDNPRTVFVISKSKDLGCNINGSVRCSLVFWGSNGELQTFEFVNDNNGKLRLGIWSSTGLTPILRDVNQNNWDKLGFAYSGSGAGYFLDNGGIKNISIAANLNTILLDYGGVAGGRHNQFNGIIDEVRIYNRALKEEEIFNVYGSILDETKLKN